MGYWGQSLSVYLLEKLYSYLSARLEWGVGGSLYVYLYRKSCTVTFLGGTPWTGKNCMSQCVPLLALKEELPQIITSILNCTSFALKKKMRIKSKTRTLEFNVHYPVTIRKKICSCINQACTCVSTIYN